MAVHDELKMGFTCKYHKKKEKNKKKGKKTLASI